MNKTTNGFTIIELIVSIIVIGILAAIVIVSYGNWHKSIITTALKSDLNGVASAMENYRNFHNGYPTAIPTTFTASDGVILSGGSSDGGKTYCVDGTSSKDSSIHYYISSIIGGTPKVQPGTCGPVDLVATAVSSSEIDLSWTAFSGATSYTVQQASNSGFSDASPLTPSGTTASATSLVASTKYYFRVKATTASGDTAWSIAHATTQAATVAPPSQPVVTVNNPSGSSIVATVSPQLTCTNGSIQYSFQNRINDGSWSDWSSWGSSYTASQTANDGVKYGYKAEARCYISSTENSSATIGSEGTYIEPIQAPSSPTVTANTVSDTTTWSWPAVTCTVGTPSYQYDYTISPAGYDSGWVAISSSPVSFTTNTSAQTYTVSVQAKCSNSITSSSWSIPPGLASYVSPASASSFVVAWGETDSSLNEAITQTSDGGYVVAGTTDEYGAGYNDAFIAKYTSTGTLSWSKTWGGADDDCAHSMVETSDGGYVITGETWSYGTGGYANAFIAKFTSTGTLSWSKTWRGADYNAAYSIIQTSDGGYAIAGQTKDDEQTFSDAFIAKFTSIGTLSWSKILDEGGDYSIDYINSIIQTTDGGYAVTLYSSYMDEDVYTYYTYPYIVKLTSTGELSWSKTWIEDSSYEEYANSIIQTTDGGYAIAGSTGLYGAGAEDAFIAKFTSTGTLSWSKTWGGADNDYAYSIIQTSDGGYAVAGTTDSYGAGDGDEYIAKFTSTGTLSWSKTWGIDGSAEEVWEIIQTADGGYAIAGEIYRNSWDKDAYIAKHKFDGTINNCSSPMCQSISPTVTSPTIYIREEAGWYANSVSATVTSPSATTTSPSATITIIVAPS